MIIPANNDPEHRLIEIAASEFDEALRSLYLLGDDPYLSMRALNLSIVDEFILSLEEETRRKLIEEERTPIEDAILLSAQPSR